jgi:hypothetical protein
MSSKLDYPGKELGVVRSGFRTVLDDYCDAAWKEGLERRLGKKTEKILNKTARAMLAKGCSPQEIMGITGISGERLQKLVLYPLINHSRGEPTDKSPQRTTHR